MINEYAKKKEGEREMILDNPTNSNIETDPKELRRKIRLENNEILRHGRTLQELKIQQKKIALEKLEATINTFSDDAIFLKLSENGDVVRIQFESESTQDVIVNGNSVIEMLYNVLKYGFIGVKGE